MGSGNTFVGVNGGNSNTTGVNNTTLGTGANVGSNDLNYATAIGAGAVVSTSDSIVLGRSDGSDTVFVMGVLRTGLEGIGQGSVDVCRNYLLHLSVCSSSLRYKNNVHTFTNGLNVVRKLRPITFNWINGGMSDVGFAAEEVNEVEPLLATRNEKGEIEGVKYKQITTVLVNAVNEQQSQIEAQNKTIDSQQARIDAQQKQIEQQKKQFESLTKIVCEMNSKSDICRQ